MAKQYYVSKYVYASHKQRLINYFVDSFISSLLLIIVIVIRMRSGDAYLYHWYKSMNLFEEIIFTKVHVAIYCLLSELFFGSTLGKLISGSKIVDIYGEKPSKQSIVIRSIGRLIPFEIFSFLTEYCRGWHDKLSYTYVVDIDTFETEVNEFHEE